MSRHTSVETYIRAEKANEGSSPPRTSMSTGGSGGQGRGLPERARVSHRTILIDRAASISFLTDGELAHSDLASVGIGASGISGANLPTA